MGLICYDLDNSIIKCVTEKQFCHVPRPVNFPKEVHKDLIYNILLLIKKASLHRTKVRVRLRDYYRTFREFLKYLFQQEVLFSYDINLPY